MISQVGFFSVNKRSDLVLYHNDCIVFASESMIIIYDLEFNLKKILKGHTDQINDLCMMNDLIISASSDSTVRIWSENHKILNLNDSVIAISALPSKDESWLVAACADGSMHIYRFVKDTIQEFGSFNSNSKYVLALKMGILPNKIPFFLAGGSDNQLVVYILQNNQFVKILSLSGHSDWIKSIDLMVYTGGKSLSDGLMQNGDIMIASASQDHFIRLWKLSADLSM